MNATRNAAWWRETLRGNQLVETDRPAAFVTIRRRAAWVQALLAYLARQINAALDAAPGTSKGILRDPLFLEGLKTLALREAEALRRLLAEFGETEPAAGENPAEGMT